MTEKREFDFEEFKKEAIKGMYAGKPMNGEKGNYSGSWKLFKKCLNY